MQWNKISRKMSDTTEHKDSWHCSANCRAACHDIELLCDGHKSELSLLWKPEVTPSPHYTHCLPTNATTRCGNQIFTIKNVQNKAVTEITCRNMNLMNCILYSDEIVSYDSRAQCLGPGLHPTCTGLLSCHVMPRKKHQKYDIHRGP